ncbi:MAG: ABC transporter substrate-binding protein, partial [Geodermatophilaceae bacterium]
MAVSVLALALAGCGSGNAEDTSPSDAKFGGGGAVGQAFDPDRDGPAAPLEGAVAGGTVTVLGAFELPPTLDPTEAYYTQSVSILSGLVTRSLTQFVYDPVSGSMVLVPDIATDLGTSNADFTEWTFTIREGVKFEDGSKVTAEDVAYGIKRSFDRAAFPGGASFSNDYFLNGNTYQGVYTSGTSYPGIEVNGDTLTLKMERPFPDMQYWGSFPAMGPIPERGSDPATYARHPLATGPYKFADYTPGKSLTLVRNEQWDPDTDPGRHQYPERYEFTFEVPQERIDATILGDSVEAQTTLSVTNVLVDDYRRAQALDRLTLTS